MQSRLPLPRGWCRVLDQLFQTTKLQAVTGLKKSTFWSLRYTSVTLSSVEHKHVLSFINVFKYPPDGNVLLTRLITVICIGAVYRPESQCVWHSARIGVSVSLLCELYNQSTGERNNWLAERDGKWEGSSRNEHSNETVENNEVNSSHCTQRMAVISFTWLQILWCNFVRLSWLPKTPYIWPIIVV